MISPFAEMALDIFDADTFPVYKIKDWNQLNREKSFFRILNTKPVSPLSRTTSLGLPVREKPMLETAPSELPKSNKVLTKSDLTKPWKKFRFAK